MRIVYMGTPQFAVNSLEALADAHEVAAVVTAPDKPAGRGMKLISSPVKEAAQRLGIPVLQPERLKATEFVSQLAALKADLFVVVAFRMLPEVVWSMPPKGTINLHASLLPAYRGAAPINWAIINGEPSTGLSTFFIEKEIDTGLVIDQKELSIGADENAGSLHDRMMEAGAALLLKTVNAIADGSAKGTPQHAPQAGEDKLPLAPKIFKEDCLINWNRPAAEVHNHIRGLSPYPGAFSYLYLEDKAPLMLKIFASQAVEDFEGSGTPGSLHIRHKELLVRCADGALSILELQPSGKKRMATAAFLNGYSLTANAALRSDS